MDFLELSFPDADWVSGLASSGGGSYARSSLTSGSPPSVTEKRIFKALSLRSLHGEVHTARSLAEVAHISPGLFMSLSTEAFYRRRTYRIAMSQML